jgi:archaeal flagellin FlaB
MLNRLIRLHRDQKGITGLETAIILIAFVVVAAVFAYTVLSAGLFSTQKSQEAIYAGLSEAESTLVLRGSAIAYTDPLSVADPATGVGVGRIQFTVTNNGKDRVDLTAPYDAPDGVNSLQASGNENPMQIAFTDEAVTIPDCAWTLGWVGKNNGDSMLDPDEKAIITLWLHTADADGVYAAGANPPFMAGNEVDTYHKFTVEVKPAQGAVLTIQRTTPALLDAVMDLH